ncbi:MAG: protein translocase subunit SecF [Thermoanaerobaculia bacterium]
MDLFANTRIDFMKYRRVWIALSIVAVTITVFMVFVHGKLNLGIDFAGGTQLTVRFADPPEVDEIRRVVGEAGIEEAQIQRFGEAEAHEVIIKTPTLEGESEGSRGLIEASFDEEYNGGGGGFDLNQRGVDALAELLLAADPDQVRAGDETLAGTHYRRIAERIVEQRGDLGLLTDWSQVTGVEGVTPETAKVLQEQTKLGRYAIVGAENVGPQIGSELRRKGIWAVVLSLLGMLAYIWLRFELRFGIGALVAVAHDVLVVLGLFTFFDFEFNLTTVAAFLTLVGYSVNDTVVVFDRVRENMRQNPREPLESVMNTSINQTLSRTLLTSGTTLLTVACLLFLGGDVLRGFGFILTVGIIVGTYSSIYIASPFALLWEQVFGGQARARRKAA